MKKIEKKEIKEEIRDKYDKFYLKFDNIERIKEKERHCFACNKIKMIRYKLDGRPVCISPCLHFITGMSNQANWGRDVPPD